MLLYLKCLLIAVVIVAIITGAMELWNWAEYEAPEWVGELLTCIYASVILSGVIWILVTLWH